MLIKLLFLQAEKKKEKLKTLAYLGIWKKVRSCTRRGYINTARSKYNFFIKTSAKHTVTSLFQKSEFLQG